MDNYFEKKKDQGKLRYSLLVWDFVKGMVEVMEFGAKKYSEDSWQILPDAERRYKDAAIRHLTSDDATDAESGLSPLLHVACSCMFLWWLQQHKEEFVYITARDGRVRDTHINPQKVRRCERCDCELNPAEYETCDACDNLPGA
jgi:hypothetical protein